MRMMMMGRWWPRQDDDNDDGTMMTMTSRDDDDDNGWRRRRSWWRGEMRDNSDDGSMMTGWYNSDGYETKWVNRIKILQNIDIFMKMSLDEMKYYLLSLVWNPTSQVDYPPISSSLSPPLSSPSPTRIDANPYEPATARFCRSLMASMMFQLRRVEHYLWRWSLQASLLG